MWATVRKPFDVLQRFQSKFNEFHLTSRGESKGFALKKSTEFIGSELLQVVSGVVFQSFLNRMEQFSNTSYRCTSRIKSFKHVPCANLMKMETHCQFILNNWNITSPKMVRNNILRK